MNLPRLVQDTTSLEPRDAVLCGCEAHIRYRIASRWSATVLFSCWVADGMPLTEVSPGVWMMGAMIRSTTIQGTFTR